ncbi:hypothetical protein T492DRAFT_869862 [Pavlovales sp. CCMP2436]|nr:hypothetical protein T492DRAFT_869862 [Pavlovales sp. CCMP2436]
MRRLSLLSLLALLAAPTLAKNNRPHDANELEAAVLLFNPGDRIVLLDQIYFLTRPINLTMRSHLIFEGQGSTFWNVIFQNGYASMGGGVLVQESSSLIVTSFNGNQAQRGDGLGLNDSSLVNVWECTFSANAASVGGALFAEGGDACSVDRSAFRSNTAETKGPAIAIKGVAVFQLGLKNKFEGNTVDSSPQALPVVATSSSVAHSSFQGKILSQLECASAESSATAGGRLKLNGDLKRFMENVIFYAQGAHAQKVELSAMAAMEGGSLVVPTWKHPIPVVKLEVVEIKKNGRPRRLGKVELDFDAQPYDAGWAAPSAVELSVETLALTTRSGMGFATGLVVWDLARVAVDVILMNSIVSCAIRRTSYYTVGSRAARTSCQLWQPLHPTSLWSA